MNTRLRAVPTLERPPQSWRAMLPCPHCDGGAKLLSAEAYHEGSGIGAYACVVCTRCGAGCPTVEDANIERPIEAVERHAIRLWNRRGTHQNAMWKLRRTAQILNTEFGGA